MARGLRILLVTKPGREPIPYLIKFMPHIFVNPTVSLGTGFLRGFRMDRMSLIHPSIGLTGRCPFAYNRTLVAVKAQSALSLRSEALQIIARIQDCMKGNPRKSRGGNVPGGGPVSHMRGDLCDTGTW
jgi:hypothetical protein